MNIYEYVPQKNFKKLSGIVMILICLSLVLFLIPSIFPDMPLRWVLQLVGIGCLSAVIYISVRKVGRAFIYRITQNDDGSRDFTVTEVTNGGKTRITVCRISLSNIEEVSVLDRRNVTDKLRIHQLTGGKRFSFGSYSGKNGGARKLFVYHPDFNASCACYVAVTECGEPLTIKLAEDKMLMDYLKGLK